MNSLFKTITDSQPTEVVSLNTAKVEEQRILIEDLELKMFIGVYDHEKQQKQRVLVSAEIDVIPPQNWRADNVSNILSYADVIDLINTISEEDKHIELVETFAEKIIEKCLQFPEAQSMSVTVKKPDIVDNAKYVGVTIKRSKS